MLKDALFSFISPLVLPTDLRRFRAAALAEAGWSYPSRRNYTDFLRRLRPLTDDQQRRGIAVNLSEGLTKE